MKYLVEALDTYKRFNISDNELKKIPTPGTRWEVSKERLEILLGKNSHGKVFIKVLKDIEPKKEQAVLKKKTEKARK